MFDVVQLKYCKKIHNSMVHVKEKLFLKIHKIIINHILWYISHNFVDSHEFLNWPQTNGVFPVKKIRFSLLSGSKLFFV